MWAMTLTWRPCSVRRELDVRPPYDRHLLYGGGGRRLWIGIVRAPFGGTHGFQPNDPEPLEGFRRRTALGQYYLGF